MLVTNIEQSRYGVILYDNVATEHIFFVAALRLGPHLERPLTLGLPRAGRRKQRRRSGASADMANRLPAMR